MISTLLNAQHLNVYGVIIESFAVVWLVVSGRLETRRHVEERLNEYKERNRFLEQHLITVQETNSELVRQNSELLVTAKVSNTILQAIHPAETGRGNGVLAAE